MRDLHLINREGEELQMKAAFKFSLALSSSGHYPSIIVQTRVETPIQNPTQDEGQLGLFSSPDCIIRQYYHGNKRVPGAWQMKEGMWRAVSLQGGFRLQGPRSQMRFFMCCMQKNVKNRPRIAYWVQICDGKWLRWLRNCLTKPLWCFESFYQT